MAKIDFACPHCGQKLNGPEEMAGQVVDCPVCNKRFHIPGGVIEIGSQRPPSPPPGNQGPVSCGPFYFPRNPAAIWSYYLGVASFLFCFFAGIPALITGICGLVHARHHPEGRGVGHSIFGIVMGGVSIVVMLALIITVIVNN